MKTVNRAVVLLGAMLISAAAVFGQSARQQSGLDISGDWFNAGATTDSGATVELVEYHGMPFNEAGRLYALTWSPSRMTLPQQQCAQYEPTRLLHGGGNYRFWEDRDPYDQRLIAIKMYGQITEGARTVWMDGRPHPPAYAQHTWSGFSTGKYEGSVLTVYTTHLKRGWIRANGLAQSDEATVTEHFIRHGDRITYFAVVNDPVYLAEPFSRTYTLGRNVKEPDTWLYACDDGEQILGRREDQVDSYHWGQHPFLREFADSKHIPLLATLGGPETMYPEILAKLKDQQAMEAAATAELTPSAGPPHASRAA